MISKLCCLVIFYTLLSDQIGRGYAKPILGPGKRMAIGGVGLYAFVAVISDRRSTHLQEKFICSGALISMRLVLTVAECVQDRSLDEIEIVFGYINEKQLGITEGSYRRPDTSNVADLLTHRVEFRPPGPFAVAKIMTSSMWSTMNKKPSSVPPFNDVAIIQLTTKVLWRPVSIPDYKYPQEFNPNVELVGWGKAEKNRNIKLCKGEKDIQQFNRAQKSPMTIISNTACEKIVKDRSRFYSNTKFKLPDNIFCILSPTGDIGLDGDIGGPVITLTGKFPTPYLLGILVKRTTTPTPLWLDKGPVNFVLRLQGFSEFIKYALEQDSTS